MTEEEVLEIAHAELRRLKSKPKTPLKPHYYQRCPRLGRPDEPGWEINCDYSHIAPTMDPNSATLYVYESDRSAYLRQSM